MRSLKKTIALADKSLLFLTLVAIPLGMFVFGVACRLRTPPPYSWIPFSLGLLSIAIRLLHLFLSGKDQFNSLWAEFRFLTQAQSSWSLGSGIACMAIGTFFLFPSDSNLASRFEASLGLYTGILGATLAINAFYRQTAPITDADSLLKNLNYDLNACPDRSKIWFVYPALNIGYYRSLQEAGINREDIDHRLPNNCPYEDFRVALRRRATRLGRDRVTAVTYPSSLYKVLYQRYEENIHGSSNINSDRVNGCAEEAQSLTGDFTTKELSPEAFPQHVIIIGDVVYTVMSYGLPIYKPDPQSPDDPINNVWGGKFVAGEPQPASLLVYRREDPILSKLISNHLEILVG
jgi:hypothetical protein